MGKWTLTNCLITGSLVLARLNLVEYTDVDGRVWKVGEAYECGEIRSDTAFVMVMQWVVDQPLLAAGDVISFPDGTVFQVSVRAAEA